MAFVTPLPLAHPRTFTAVRPRHAHPRCCLDASVPASTHVSRRAAIVTAATAAAAAVFAGEAQALGMKRMLAKAGPVIELENGISYREISVGKGNSPLLGDQCTIHYSLYYNDFEIESSRESQGLAASPIGFTFGAEAGPGSIIPALMNGVDGMKVGGVRLVTSPPDFAFGDRGRKPMVPGGATVQFAIQLMSVKPSGKNPNVNYSGSSMF